MLVFSNSADKTGLVEQVRALMRVDSDQWITSNIVNSCNNYLDTVTGYAIGADRRFQFDSTNHSKLPIGTTGLIENQSDYSFLIDEQGNKILSLTAISIIEIATNKEIRLFPVDINSSSYDFNTFAISSGTPTSYDKISDNVIRLNYLPTSADSSKYKLKFYFQRTPYYFVVTDTTRETGMPTLLDRGFIINAAYDGALTLGLNNLQALSIEKQLEDKKMQEYFTIRETDEPNVIIPKWRSAR